MASMWTSGGAWFDTRGVVLFGAIALFTPAIGRAQELTGKLAVDCASLKEFSIPASAIALPTEGALVQGAEPVAADAEKNVNGAFCKVTGVIRNATASTAVFQFEVNLPNAWNGRAVQFGGGGYDGSLVTGLTRFGKQSVKKTHDVALAIIEKAYGRPPARFYFIGGSQGGHEALDAAARYPQDYDGVIAHYPAYNVTLLHLGSFNVGRALYQNGGAGWMDAQHLELLTDAVYAKCDDLDGAKDGIISNVTACDRAFDPKTLRCASGATGESCLSDAQLQAIATIATDYKPGVTVAGMDAFPKWGRFWKAPHSPEGRNSDRRSSPRTRCRARRRSCTESAIRRSSSSSPATPCSTP